LFYGKLQTCPLFGAIEVNAGWRGEIEAGRVTESDVENPRALVSIALWIMVNFL
jgi:hypothetical protein